MVAEPSNRFRYEFGVAFLADRMCGLSHDDLWVQARVLRLLEQSTTEHSRRRARSVLREARSVSVVQVELMDSRLSGLRYVEQFLNGVQEVYSRSRHAEGA